VYDFANRVSDVTDSSGGSTPCTGRQSGDNESFTYDGLDDVLTACTPEGTVTYQYDSIGRRKNMAPASLPVVSYMYDNTNEITSVAATGTSATIGYSSDAQRNTLTVNNVTSTYAYDPVTERLGSISYASTQNPSLGSLSYSYDADGRVTGKTGSLAIVRLPVTEGPGITYYGTNQLETWNNKPVNPDPANNLVTDPSSSSNATYAWAARNDLYKVTTNNGTDTYTYDAGGRRESVVSGGSTTKYLYDGRAPVSAGAVNIVSLPGSNEILTLSGVVPIRDALGSTLATVNSSGALATQYTYDPFGNVTPGSSGYGTTFGMGGIELDPTGLYHADARYYNPTLQRFLSEDPAGHAGSGANLFAYSGNGPVGASDPSGLDSCPNGDCGGGQPSNDPNSLPSPGGLDGLIQAIFQAIFGVSPTSTPPANHTNFQEIKQAGLTQATAGISLQVVLTFMVSGRGPSGTIL
jgi:RHS repeat-associated protein